jgi:ABC-type transporter Mla subunit MlaD
VKPRRAQASIAANPVLIGAVTILVTVVAVFLAYNANSGLPFIPTRQLNVNVSNGAQLVAGNEVREGGYRVGVVEDIRPTVLKDGTSGARLKLKLDIKNAPYPVDSAVTIRPRSALGLKYVEVRRGKEKKFFADGDTMPATQAHVPVQLEDVFSTFDGRTRINSRRNLVNFGGAFAARGTDLNITVSRLPSLFQRLVPVARNLRSPKTDLKGFFRGTGRAAAALRPVTTTNTKLFRDLGTTFEALTRNPGALEATIDKSPQTLDVGTRALRAQRPFLERTADFSVDLSRAARELRVALPDLVPALQIGAPVLRRSVKLNRELQKTMVELRALAEDPRTYLGLRAVTDTVGILNPMIRFLGPQVTVCNFWNYFWTYVAEHLSEEDANGFAQRALLNSNAIQTDSVGTIPAAVPANGKGYQVFSAPLGSKEFLHGQPYGSAITKNGRADCENGQRGYPSGRLTSAPRRFNIVTNAHTPGAQGPTYTGRARVPKGQTFQREPNVNALNDAGNAIVNGR